MESLSTIIIVVHLLIVLALIVTVLLQRSEGGALGMGGGGGGGGGGIMSARGAGNLLSRTTAILAVLFFATSIGLTVLARVGENSGSLLNEIEQLNSTGTVEGAGSVNAIESLLGTGEDATTGDAPAGDGLAVPTE